MTPFSLHRAAALAALAMVAQVLPVPDAWAQAGNVARGEYLARAGDCISCHTASGGAPFAGGYRLDTPFGYMLAPNITPDPDTGIGNWSGDDFYRALHDGVNKRGQDMYPTMPFDFYTRATRADIDAIFAYLRTVKPRRNEVDVNHLDFPFDRRWTMGAWRELYFREGTYRANPVMSAAWNRGAYLVEGFGHCSDCHSPRNLLGGIEKSKDFEGAVVDGWFALDLTSDIVTGLGAWTVGRHRDLPQDRRLQGEDHHAGTDGRGRAQQHEPSHRCRPAVDGGIPEIDPAGFVPSHRDGSVPTRTARRRRRHYLDHCGGCHQAKGRGIPGVFPPLAGQRRRRSRPIRPTSSRWFCRAFRRRISACRCHPSRRQLTDAEVASIANYLRTSWGNAAAPDATAAEVARLRGGVR